MEQEETAQELEAFCEYRKRFEAEEATLRAEEEHLANVTPVESGEYIDDEENQRIKGLRYTAFRGMFGPLSDDRIPLLKISLEGKPTVALMDLGATHCIISKDLCDTFLKVVIDTSKKRTLNQVVNSTETVGMVRLRLRWAGGYKKQSFIVIPKSIQEVILGRDFLRDAEIIPDLSKGIWTSVQKPGEKIQFQPTCLRVELTTKDWEEAVSKSECPEQFKPELTRILVGDLNTFQFTAGSAKGVTLLIRGIIFRTNKNLDL